MVFDLIILLPRYIDVSSVIDCWMPGADHALAHLDLTFLHLREIVHMQCPSSTE
jgi:hypothetical protein